MTNYSQDGSNLLPENERNDSSSFEDGQKETCNTGNTCESVTNQQFLNVPPSAAKMKPTIRMCPGSLDSIVDTAEKSLAETGDYFQTSGAITSIGKNLETDETIIIEISQSKLLRQLSLNADWVRYDATKQEWVIKDPGYTYVKVLYEAGQYPHLPKLRGIARQPYLSVDRGIVKDPGYNHETGLYGDFNPEEYNIPENPTKEDALASLEILLSLISEVAFEHEVDRAAALCVMLTAVIRPSLPTAPAFLTTARCPGSGKSFLNTLFCIMATPNRVAGMAFPKDADEMKKTLISEFIKSPPVINFDDMSGDIIPIDSLKTALTEEFITARLLGGNKTVTCSTRALMLISGNNIQALADMIRRLLTIKLDPKLENPATRSFERPNLESEARRDRALYVSAALTIIRAFIVAGMPTPAVKNIASFVQWSELCRWPLIWLGLPDPATRMFEQMDHDPDRELLGRVLQAWYSCFGSMGKLARDLIPHGNEDLKDGLMEVAGERGELKTKLLGWWLKRNEGRIVDGLKITGMDASRGSKKWRVEQVMQVSQVNLPQNENDEPF